MRTVKKYSDEFKADAVSLIKEMSISKAAKKLGISTSTLHGWYSKSLVEKSGPNGKKQQLSYEELSEKLKKTEKELRYIDEINKILKKSLGIRALDHHNVLKK